MLMLQSAKLSTISDSEARRYSPIPSIIDQIREAPQTETCRWWLAECRGQFDARLIADLRKAGAFPLEIFTPQAREHSRGPNRQDKQSRIIDTPVFAGYVFFNGTHDHRASAMRSIATLKVVHVNQQEKLAAELVGFMSAFQRNRNPRIVNPRRGQKVRITAGAFVGQEGEYLQSCPNHVYVNVGILGRAVELEVDPSHIEPL